MEKLIWHLLGSNMDVFTTFSWLFTKPTVSTLSAFFASASWTSFTRYLWFTWPAKLTDSSFQSYFVIRIFNTLYGSKRRLPYPVIVCVQYIVCYYVYMVSLIQVFEEVNKLSKQLLSKIPCRTVNRNYRYFGWQGFPSKKFDTKAPEIFFVQKMYQNFTFSIYGVERVDYTLLTLVIIFEQSIVCYDYFFNPQITSSICTFLIILLQFKMTEDKESHT